MSDPRRDSVHESATSANLDPMAETEPLHVDRYEGIWVRVSGAMLFVFSVLVIYASSSLGIQLPGMHMRIDPRTVATPGSSPFADPQVNQLADDEYEAYIRSQIWQFTPAEIRIPAGSKLTMYVTSQDVIHGFHIDKTNVNVMVLPGQVTKVAARFAEPGVYNFICHEYCGLAHHTMFGRIVVESAEMIAAASATAEAIASNPITGTVASAGNAERGKANFSVCSACHGPNGEGVTGLGKPLTTSEFVAGLSDAELVEFFKVGRGVDDPLNTSGIAMPPKGGNPALDDADLLDMVAYIRTFQQ